MTSEFKLDIGDKIPFKFLGVIATILDREQRDCFNMYKISYENNDASKTVLGSWWTENDLLRK